MIESVRQRHTVRLRQKFAAKHRERESCNRDITRGREAVALEAVTTQRVFAGFTDISRRPDPREPIPHHQHADASLNHQLTSEAFR